MDKHRVSVPDKTCRLRPGLGTTAKFPQAPVSGREPDTGAKGLDFCVFGKGKRVLDIDPEIADRILNLAMTEKDLDSSQIAGRPIDDRCLRAPKRVGAIVTAHKADTCHPFVDKPSILPSAQVCIVIDPAWENKVVHRAAPPFEPCQ